MKKLCCRIKLICSCCNKIHLVDKCLLLFMFVLLIQSAYSLFVLPNSMGEDHTIDIIVRTSISGIFGYFLSANFIRHESSSQSSESSKKETPVILNNTGDAAIKNSIGFTPSETNTELKQGNISLESEQKTKREKITGNLQIIVATSIGLFCLIILILVRNLSALHLIDLSHTSFTATVSQFRDLVSGCVGFLIGCPTINKRN